jgi:hypothetical protein
MQKKAPPARSRQGDHCRLRDTTFHQRQCPAGILEPCHFVIAKTGGGGFGAIAFDKGFQRIAELGGCVAQRHVHRAVELDRDEGFAAVFAGLVSSPRRLRNPDR